MAKASKMNRKAKAARTDAELEPTPSLLLMDIGFRTALRIGRRYLERGVLRKQLGAEQAKRTYKKKRGVTKKLTSIMVSRFAARSIPGAMLVGSGILVKTLYDQRKAERRAELKARAEASEKTPGGPGKA